VQDQVLLGLNGKSRIRHSGKNLCLSGESSSFCFLGLLYRIVYSYSRSHREEQFGLKRGEKEVGDITNIHLQAMHSKENSASHCALFSFSPLHLLELH